MNSLISSKAKIGKGTVIGAFVIIEDDVEVGENCYIGDYCRISKNVSIGNRNHLGARVSVYENSVIGDDNHIADNCILGLPSQHIGYHHYRGSVIIGNNNHICECCTIGSGNNFVSDKKQELLPYTTEWNYPDDATVIGNKCFILSGVTIHHNCHIGLGNVPDSGMEYDTIICSNCTINGFVHVGKGCNLGSATCVRQWMTIGCGAVIAMGEHIVKNVPHFAKILKNRNCGPSGRMELFGLKNEDLQCIEMMTVDPKFY